MRPKTTRSVDANGARFHVAEAGEGPVIVLVHSGITDADMWDAQVEVLAVDRRVVTYDLRGFGRSTIPAAGYAHHDDLLALLDVLDVESATFVGASFGGEVVLAFAIEHPDRVDALVLVNTLAGVTDLSPELRSGWRAFEAAVEAGRFDDAVEIELRMWVDGPHRAASEVDAGVRERVRMMDAALLRRAAEQEAATERELDPPVLERLGEITAPTLVVVGGLDLRDALVSANVLVSSIPGAQRIDIPNAAHLPSLERPDEFNAAMLAFLAASPAAG